MNQDELASFQQQQAEFENEKYLLEKNEAYKTQYNVGTSLTYTKKLKNDRIFKGVLYVQNLLDTRYRYYVSTGSSRSYPNRLSYMEEPITLGLRLELKH